MGKRTSSRLIFTKHTRKNGVAFASIWVIKVTPWLHWIGVTDEKADWLSLNEKLKAIWSHMNALNDI